MFAGSVSRLLAKRAVLQSAQTTLAAYIGTGPYNALTTAQKSNLQAQNTAALAKISAMTARVTRKTGHG